MPAPVPRLIEKALRIPARIAQAEPERGGMAAEPLECRGVFKGFIQWGAAFHAKIYGATAVVLAVPGGALMRSTSLSATPRASLAAISAAWKSILRKPEISCSATPSR